MKAYFILLLALPLCSSNAEPEFVGLLTTKGSSTQFVVVVVPGSPPQWATIGGSVGGYALWEYKESDEVLVLRKDGREFSLKLKASKVQPADYRGQPMPLAAAKQLIGSSDGWDSGVSYSIFRDNQGNWCLAASQRVEKRVRLRFIPLTPESVPADSDEIVPSDRPNKAPEPTPTAVTPRANE